MPRWTAAARKKQSEIQKTRQSWKHSTGPKTVAGKSRSSLNAWKHGLDSRSTFALRRALRNHSKFLACINMYITAAKRQKRADAALAALNSSPSPLWGEDFHSALSPQTFKTPERTRQTRLLNPDSRQGQPFPFPKTPAIKASCFP